MARFPDNDLISLLAETPRYELAESVGPDLRLRELVEGGDGVRDLLLAYTTPEGDPRLRARIAELHGVSPDDVVITVGSMHALFLLAFLLVNRGEDAVMTTPCFPLARNVLEAVGARLHTVSLSFERGYVLDVAQVREKLSEKTKLVSLASPNNPSGVAIARDTLEAVLAAMRERCPDAHLLVDETYREAVYGDDPLAPPAISLGPKVVTVAALSKCHGAPGLRIGWAITRDRELRQRLVTGKFNTVISCSALDEALAVKVFEQRDRIIGARRSVLAQGIERTAAWARANAGLVDWVRPNAGALSCARLSPSAFDDAGVRRFYDALSTEGVRVANGTWFGDEARVFRLGFGLMSMPDLEAALEKLTAVLKRTALQSGA
ncbi:pyridoxal phosphate-dependent aminotransferase [Pendulispora brunnea]|uniref:Pyridoxal phosphate-dependent aminotransferase n=1 Tax=Pendulispora brunnea TaxID=2905690 RepID=A0ABZ2KN73_9BACT